MRRINYIINSEMTRSEKSDSIDNSIETGSKEYKIFENSRTEMENLLMNGDEKTDNEVTKNLGQLGNKKQGFQKTLKTNSTKEQSRMSKNGTSAVEEQKISLALLHYCNQKLWSLLHYCNQKLWSLFYY